MEEILPILEKCPLFNGISSRDVARMLCCFDARTVKLKKDNPVFSEGDSAVGVGIVLTGGIQTLREDYLGHRTIVSMASAGELFCESFSCAGVDALPVSMVAARDSAVLILDCERILTVCHHACPCHNRIVRNLLHSVAQSNLRLNQKIEILSKRTTREKVMCYLLSEAKIQGADAFVIPYDRQELADFLGVERSAMSTVIGKLRSEGVIEVNRRWFRILQHRQNAD